jgi:hypothetical protein
MVHCNLVRGFLKNKMALVQLILCSFPRIAYSLGTTIGAILPCLPSIIPESRGLWCKLSSLCNSTLYKSREAYLLFLQLRTRVDVAQSCTVPWQIEAPCLTSLLGRLCLVLQKWQNVDIDGFQDSYCHFSYPLGNYTESSVVREFFLTS